MWDRWYVQSNYAIYPCDNIRLGSGIKYNLFSCKPSILQEIIAVYFLSSKRGTCYVWDNSEGGRVLVLWWSD